MSKYVFVIKEQLCQSFWLLIKVFRFEAKKIEGGPFNPPLKLLGLTLKLPLPPLPKP